MRAATPPGYAWNGTSMATAGVRGGIEALRKPPAGLEPATCGLQNHSFNTPTIAASADAANGTAASVDAAAGLLTGLLTETVTKLAALTAEQRAAAVRRALEVAHLDDAGRAGVLSIARALLSE